MVRIRMRNCYRSVKQALENGKVVETFSHYNYYGNHHRSIRIKYFKPFTYRNGWSITSEWYDVSERYYKSFVEKHRNG